MAESLKLADTQRLLKTFLRDVSQKNKVSEAIDGYLPKVEPLSDYVKSDEIPFSSERKYSACIYPDITLVLGAPEILLAKSSPALKTIHDYTSQAYRVVTFGFIKGKFLEKGTDVTKVFQPLAILAMEDPVREEAPSTLASLVENKMEYRIISGDSPDTVAAIANRINKDYPAKVITGEELDKLPPAELETAILDHNIYARIKPQQKQLIIRTLKKNKMFTIMIGDGVNDVLALKESDLGIAMNSGSSMAKDVADIVLLNNSFKTLPILLSESRRIITNIQAIANVYLIKNISFITAILILGFIGLRFPFDPKHTEINSILTIGIPSIFLALEKHDFVTTDEGFLNRLLVFSGIVGFINAVAMSIIYIYFEITSEKLFYSRTLILTTIVFLGIINLALIYRQHYTWLEMLRRKIFVGLVLTILVLLAAVLFVPQIKSYSNIADLAFIDLFISFGISAIASIFSYQALRRVNMIK